MIRRKAFMKKQVYSNRVRKYFNNEKIYKLSSDMNELCEFFSPSVHIIDSFKSEYSLNRITS